VPDADHHTIYSAAVIGPRLVDWLRGPKSRRSRA
jgi:hypothetical protein